VFYFITSAAKLGLLIFAWQWVLDLNLFWSIIYNISLVKIALKRICAGSYGRMFENLQQNLKSLELIDFEFFGIYNIGLIFLIRQR